MRKHRGRRLRGAIHAGSSEKSQKVSAVDHERAFVM
jgi:hypothetical protein